MFGRLPPPTLLTYVGCKDTVGVRRTVMYERVYVCTRSFQTVPCSSQKIDKILGDREHLASQLSKSASHPRRRSSCGKLRILRATFHWRAKSVGRALVGRLLGEGTGSIGAAHRPPHCGHSNSHQQPAQNNIWTHRCLEMRVPQTKV